MIRFQMLSFVLIALLVSPNVAQDERAQVTKRLVSDLWNKDGANRQQSTIEFQRIGGMSSEDSRLLRSYILNQMQHDRHRDALKVAERLTIAAPNQAEGWLYKSWLDSVTDQYDRAMISVQQLKKAVVATPDLSDDARRRYFQLMGQIVGYLQGPVAGRPNPATLQTTITRVAEGLDEATLKWFNDGRDSVLDQYEQLGDEQSVAHQEFTEKSKADMEVQVQTLQSTNQSLDQRNQQISPELDRLSSESSRRSDELRTRMAPVEQAIASANQAINSIQLSLQPIYQEILFQQSLLFRTRDPLIRLSITARINDLSYSARMAETDLNAAGNQRASSQNQLGALVAERNQLIQFYDGQMRQLRAEQKENDRQKRRNLAKVERLVSGPVRVTGKAASIKNEIVDFTTYAPFPLEQYRQAMIDELGK